MHAKASKSCSFPIHIFEESLLAHCVCPAMFLAPLVVSVVTWLGIAIGYLPLTTHCLGAGWKNRCLSLRRRHHHLVHNGRPPHLPRPLDGTDLLKLPVVVTKMPISPTTGDLIVHDKHDGSSWSASLVDGVHDLIVVRA